MAEIFYNQTKSQYTLKEEEQGFKSIKKVPIKFKPNDRTSKYRKEILKKEVLAKYE